MDLLNVLLSIAFGATGYLLVTFFFQPILRYRALKSKIISDLIYHAHIHDIKPQDLEINNVLKERYWERSNAIRRSAAELEACYFFLPYVYRIWLHMWKELPLKASFAMIVLSNINKSEEVSKTRKKIEKLLRLKRNDIDKA